MLNEIFNSIVQFNRGDSRPISVVVTRKTMMIIKRDSTPDIFYVHSKVAEKDLEYMLFGLPLKVDDSLKKEYEIQT